MRRSRVPSAYPSIFFALSESFVVNSICSSHSNEANSPRILRAIGCNPRFGQATHLIMRYRVKSCRRTGSRGTFRKCAAPRMERIRQWPFCCKKAVGSWTNALPEVEEASSPVWCWIWCRLKTCTPLIHSRSTGPGGGCSQGGIRVCCAAKLKLPWRELPRCRWCRRHLRSLYINISRC